MSDKGEKTCPLCAEEMDLTDQQLKPCKCGYEICVWCWHHIMEMAEKNGTEGRCPACRTPYDKEKIVGMEAKCERIVAEINSERKQKLQKAKPKASEGRMHLSNVRVIQRNLVYIIGLPLKFADEEFLQRREYFGQYGKVLKVSISRTAAGVIQHSANNSCCVYITYSKEEEAIRCIQSVHGFTLEGRHLRACFGTTKYCHAWLRNMPCSIPDCLYLHDFGSQEDSFTKDEIVSAFTRSRLQQIIGATNNMHGRSGDFLPPPVDDYINSNISSTAKPISTNSSNNIDNQNKGYCADSSTGKSSALPSAASWVMRVSATWPPNKNLSGSVRPPSEQPRISNGPQILESEAVSTAGSTYNVKLIEAEGSCEVHLDSKSDPWGSAEEHIDADCPIALPNTNTKVVLETMPATSTSKNHTLCLPSLKGSAAVSIEHNKSPSGPGSVEDEKCDIINDFQGLCSGLSSISLQNHIKKEHSVTSVVNGLASSHVSVNMHESQGFQEYISEQFSELTASPASSESQAMEDLLDFDDKQLRGLEGFHQLQSMSSSSCSPQNLDQSSYCYLQPGKVTNHSGSDSHTGIVPMKHDGVAFPLTTKNSISNGFYNNKVSSSVNLDANIDCSGELSEVQLGNYSGKCDSNATPIHNGVASDMGESSIISKILSIDSDAWEDSLTSLYSLVKLLSENDRQHGAVKIPSLLKESDSRQSRFSFARQNNFSSHISDLEHSLCGIRHSVNKCDGSNDLMKDKNFCMDEYQINFSYSSSMESEIYPSSCSHMSSSAVSKAVTSAPPGFAAPSRVPPPGFSTHGTIHKPFDSSVSPSHLLQPSTQVVRSDGGYGDVPVVDPAILEVGKGIHAAAIDNVGFEMSQTSSSQLNPFDCDAGLQLLMRQSISEYQNLRIPNDLANRFSTPNDNCISQMLYDQSQPNNPSAFVQSTAQHFRNAHMSTGHLGSWNEIKGISDLGVSDFMSNRGVGFDKFIPSYEDLSCQISSSNNLYNRGFAI